MAGQLEYKLRIPSVNSKMRCGEIEVYDATGVYDPSYNKGGWDATGVTNPSASGVTAVSFKASFSNGSVYSTSTFYDSVIPFPNITGAPKIVNTATLGFAPPDGKVSVESEVVGDFGGIEGFLGKASQSFYLTCNVWCCVMEMHTAAERTGDCNSAAWKAYDKASLIYRSLLHAIECKKFAKADVILQQLKTFCLQNGCNCGC